MSDERIAALPKRDRELRVVSITISYLWALIAILCIFPALMGVMSLASAYALPHSLLRIVTIVGVSILMAMPLTIGACLFWAAAMRHRLRMLESILVQLMPILMFIVGLGMMTQGKFT